MQSKRNFTTLFLLIVTTGGGLLFQTVNGHARRPEKKSKPPSQLNSLFQKTFDNLHSERFEEAIQTATQLRHEYPDEPAGAFGLLTAYQTISRNYRVRLYDSKIDSLLNLSIDLAEQAIKKNKKNGLNHFYLGVAYGMRCINFANQRQLFSALKNGSKVLNSFNKAIRYDPEFYDSYYGMGLFKYWLAAKSQFIRALPFSKNKRREGIEQIKLAIKKGRFLNVDAKYGLTTIYMNENEYEKALNITDELIKSYPGNPTLLYRRGRIYQALEKWQEAKECFVRLHKILLTTAYQSKSFQIDCLLQQAKCAYQMGQYDDSEQFCQAALSQQKQCNFSEELDGPMEKFSEIKDELQKLAKQLKSSQLSHVGSEEDH
ncbi:MAG: tetratricopeptide repeat protein [bacterium]